MSILIVDDLDFMRSIIREILTGAGLSVAGEARDGQEAVMKYKALKPDLVLLDIIMPGMDGITALKQLKRSDPECRVVMCSSLGDQESIIQAIRLGAIDYVVKPFQKQRLVSAVSRALGILQG
jgi:two-component system chemotaxis response regulator CheY